MLFNTHLYYKKLSEKGFSQEQSEALTDAQTVAFSEAVDKELATKDDLAKLDGKMDGLVNRLDKRMDRLESQLLLIKWMLGLVVIAEVIPLLQKLFS